MVDADCFNHGVRVGLYAAQHRGGALGNPLLASAGGNNGAAAVAIVDFNNDGIADLTVDGGTSCGTESAVLLGKGDGSFGAPMCLGTGGYGIASGDFNHDGNQNLTVASVDSRCLVYLGDGTGKIQSPAEADDSVGCEWPFHSDLLG